MGITNSNKEISVESISCGESFNIRLSLVAEPDITSNPTDIVLILDRSGSMEESMDSLKDAADAFIDIIDEATDGIKDGHIGGGSRIGIVSFAGEAVQDTQLITSVVDLKAAVDSLTSGGFTNHEDAFDKALAMFDPLSANAKVMVMFTDGVTTAGGDPNVPASAAKAQGVIIYAIGLLGNGGIDENALDEWASDPSSSYVAIAPDDEQLKEIFENLAKNIVKPGATGIVVTDTVDSCFRITGMSMPTKGTAALLNATTVRWEIEELGTTASEGATFTFTVEHVGDCSGTVAVNESVDYSDNEGNVVAFPEPEITVDCGVVICHDECSDPVEIIVGGCEDAVEYNAGELEFDGLGRILELDVTLKGVCPGRRVALAAIVTEVDSENNEYQRGVKTLTIPAHTMDSCRDVLVRCIKFVLPEELDVSGDGTSICNDRHFRARFVSHYIDSDFDCGCCEEDV